MAGRQEGNMRGWIWIVCVRMVVGGVGRSPKSRGGEDGARPRRALCIAPSPPPVGNIYEMNRPCPDGLLSLSSFALSLSLSLFAFALSSLSRSLRFSLARRFATL